MRAQDLLQGTLCPIDIAKREQCKTEVAHRSCLRHLIFVQLVRTPEMWRSLVRLASADPLAAPLIKLDGGPLFHRQLRVGKYSRVFTLPKLRTMKVGGSTEWTKQGDTRVTRAGRVLRRLSGLVFSVSTTSAI